MNDLDYTPRLTEGSPTTRRAHDALLAFVRVLESIEGVRLARWEDFGLTLQQCRVLHVIEHELQSPAQTELARRLGLRAPTVTVHLNRLMKMGLVERVPDVVDRRVRHVVLTESGRQILGALMHPVPGDLTRALGDRRPDEVEAVMEMLDQLNQWISTHADEPALPLAAAG